MLPNSCKCSDFFRLSLNKPLTINDLNRIQANSSRREVKPQLICTPLWDENNDGDFDNDGAVYHTHWVALREDDRVEGGFSVVELSEDQIKNSLPPTNPGTRQQQCFEQARKVMRFLPAAIRPAKSLRLQG